MFGEETKGQKNEQTVEPVTEAQKAVKEEPLTKNKPAGEVEEAPGAPEPMAIDSKEIAILKHDIYRKGGDDTTEAVYIELTIKNVSNTAIGSALFEAELYDIEGNILGRVEQKTVDFKPNIRRTIRINYTGPEIDKVRSYCIRVAKITITPEPKATGNDKIEILKHSLNSGISGYYCGVMAGVDIAIRNISDTAIASLVFEAIFYDIEGSVLEIVKRTEADLKPNTSRAFNIHYTKKEPHQLISYDVKITRMTTTDLGEGSSPPALDENNRRWRRGNGNC